MNNDIIDNPSHGVWYDANRSKPKPSGMEINRVIVMLADRPDWHVGWWVGGHLNQWRINGSPNAQPVTYWMAVQTPAADPAPQKQSVPSCQEHRHVKTRDGRWKPDAYTCVCGFETSSTAKFNKHIGVADLNAAVEMAV